LKLTTGGQRAVYRTLELPGLGGDTGRDDRGRAGGRVKGSCRKRRPTAGADGATTLNQYLDTARAFLNWCVQTKRTAGNALADVAKVTGEKKRKRRALDDEQFGKLLAAATEDRRLVYRFGLATGLRRAELEDLKWGDVRITATRPVVALRAEATKAHRADRLPLPLTLAADLRAHRPADATDNDRVFPTVPSLHWWRKDLEAAGIPYKDAMGRQADFHGGTRKTLCTRMHRGGVSLASAMRIMRHTDPRLTLVDYTDDEQLGTAALAEVEADAPAAPAEGGTAVG
jgi:integrase